MNRSRPSACTGPVGTLSADATPLPPPATDGKEAKVKCEQYGVEYNYEATALPFVTSAPKSLDVSAFTLALHSSCVNGNTVGVKKIHTKEKKPWAHLLQSLSSLQCTLMTDARPPFSSVTASHSRSQENGCGASMGSGPATVRLSLVCDFFAGISIPRLINPSILSGCCHERSLKEIMQDLHTRAAQRCKNNEWSDLKKGMEFFFF